jgi:dihydrofolate reductase
MIAAILASTNTGGIGLNGTLPWPKHSEDLKWFKEHTSNQIVVMGRKTWDDPMMPKPLPNRINCVVSSNPVALEYRQQQVKWLLGNPVEHIQRLSEENPDKIVYVIGGKRLYEACYSIVDRIYLTRIPANWEVDTRINLDLMLDRFRIKSVRPSQTSNCTYEIWERQFKS